MIRIGVVGADSSHPVVFTGFFNGFDAEIVRKYVERWGGPPKGFPEARVVTAWEDFAAPPPAVKPWTDPAFRQERFEQYCRDYGITERPARPEDMVDQVDAVMVLARHGCEHLRLARPFLEAGKPTFIDKPFADSMDDAREILRLARTHGAPLMCCSQYRFRPGMAAAKETFPDYRSLLSATFLGVPDFRAMSTRYGIHVIDPMVALLGVGAVSVHNLGPDVDAQLMQVRYPKQDFSCAVHLRSGGYKYFIQLTAGREIVEVPTDETGAESAQAMLSAFIDMIRTGRESVPHEEMHEAIRIVLAGEKSILEQRAVQLDEI